MRSSAAYRLVACTWNSWGRTNMGRIGDRLEGLGTLNHGSAQPLGQIEYIVYLSPATGQARVVEFATNPGARDGQLLHLELDDGRVVNCLVRLIPGSAPSSAQARNKSAAE